MENIGSWSSKHSTNTLMETCWTRQQDRSNPRSATKSSRRQHKAHLWEVKSTETQPHGPHNSKDPLPMPWCQIQIQFTPQALTGRGLVALGNLEAGLMPRAVCQDPWVIPEQLFGPHECQDTRFSSGSTSQHKSAFHPSIQSHPSETDSG